MESELIKKYHVKCCPSTIESIVPFKNENGELNPDYYVDAINWRSKVTKKELEEKDFFDSETKKRLHKENRSLNSLQIKIISFYDSVCQHETRQDDNYRAGLRTRISRIENEIKHIFKTMYYQKYFIEEFIGKGNYSSAIMTKNYLKTQLELLISYFDQWLGVELMMTPFADLFSNHINSIESVINLDEINLLKEGITNTSVKSDSEERAKEVKSNDPSYTYGDVFEIENSDFFKIYQSQINDNGSFKVRFSDGMVVEIYTPQLAFMLASENLKFKKEGTDSLMSMNELGFLKEYKLGFKEGVEYFQKEFNWTTEILYGSNSDAYVRNLHHNYFHVVIDSKYQGWQFVRKLFPLILNREVVKTNGYYAGVVSEIFGLINKHPNLFRDFFKCDKDFDESFQDKESSNELENDNHGLQKVLELENNLIPSQETLQLPYNFFEQLVKENNKDGKPYLTKKVLLDFLKRAFNKQTGIPKQKINIGSKEQKKITYFFYEFMRWSNDYENGQQNNKKYLKLLTDNFLGFEYDKIISNFHKKPSNPITCIK